MASRYYYWHQHTTCLVAESPVAQASGKLVELSEIKLLRPNLLPVKPPPPTSATTLEFVSPMEFKNPNTAGVTDEYGNIKISKALNFQQQYETVWHEEVHSALSHKARLVRQYRASLSQSAYQRSVFLRYLEEAIAEACSVIQSTQTFKGGSGLTLTKSNLRAVIEFPLKEDRYRILARQRVDVTSDYVKTGKVLGDLQPSVT